MHNLTVVIITKNEEEKIRNCLESLKGMADEIVIIDDMSTDGTVRICEEFGAKVIVNESKGNFDKQRNLGTANASRDWVIQLDADEIVSAETTRKILQAISSPGECVAFKIGRNNFFLGHLLLGIDTYAIRLFKKDKAVYIGKSVHETLQVSGAIGNIDAKIDHFPFDSIQALIQKWNFYSDVEADVYLEQIDSISEKELRKKITWKALRLFWKLYIKKKGYKDGMFGLVWCILNVIGPEIRWLKIWEKALKKNKLKTKNNTPVSYKDTYGNHKTSYTKNT
jgi:glycosyltransferase involved in cell wall biosynthesis